ncbi:MAG: hypothetical protein N2561_10125 [Bacteroidetes bacterium]|nr:hypothetical protein [Rhodothermia bacterium]MCS7155289.1 hypothetical protein [Bacteroidota bacterium]MCX7907874.1 hypothetical protein [Bacteroidota bacterium]MDW8138693.1 hypothetical protein [Bacteroidota bacterium]MDW8284721.1 hypothetical protein [Bacteroidota bacterium]
MIFTRRPTHRRFEYHPRYYDPTREQSLRERLARQRARLLRRRRRAPLSLLWMIALLLMALYLYWRL